MFCCEWLRAGLLFSKGFQGLLPIVRFCFLSFSPQWDRAAVSHHLRKPVIISPSLRFGTHCGLALSSKGCGALHELSVCPASKDQLPLGQEPVFCWDAGSARVLAWVDASECFSGIRFTTMTAACEVGKYTACLMGRGGTRALGDQMTWFVPESPEELRPHHGHPVMNLSSSPNTWEWMGRACVRTPPTRKTERGLRCGKMHLSLSWSM